jgi:predicted nucleic acid-binding protein
MSDLVLDASVALKWAMPSAKEPFATEAAKLLDRYAKNQLNLLVPDIFWAEIGNVLWKGARRRRWSLSDAQVAQKAMVALDFFTVPCRELLPDALRLALAHDRAVYDCFYVALAVLHNIDMITADEKLASTLAARLPVKWIGAFVG